MESQGSTLNTELVLILGSSGMLLMAFAIVLFIYLYQRKLIKRKLEYQKIEDLLKKQELKSAYAMLAGQEKAHKRIAEELHDNLGSILVTLNMFADTLQRKTDPESQKELAAKIGAVAQVANDATRKISHSLDSGVLKHFGLATGVQELVDAVNESGAITITSHIEINQSIDSETSLNLYRIVQELINNTLKHARASKANLDLTQVKDSLSLIFEDNGIGFEENESGKNKGMGIRNLHSRVSRLDGEITIDSKKEKGTTVIIELPIK